jgi:hypothetical protein
MQMSHLFRYWPFCCVYLALFLKKSLFVATSMPKARRNGARFNKPCQTSSTLRFVTAIPATCLRPSAANYTIILLYWTTGSSPSRFGFCPSQICLYSDWEQVSSSKRNSCLARKTLLVVGRPRFSESSGRTLITTQLCWLHARRTYKLASTQMPETTRSRTMTMMMTTMTSTTNTILYTLEYSHVVYHHLNRLAAIKQISNLKVDYTSFCSNFDFARLLLTSAIKHE